METPRVLGMLPTYNTEVEQPNFEALPPAPSPVWPSTQEPLPVQPEIAPPAGQKSSNSVIFQRYLEDLERMEWKPVDPSLGVDSTIAKKKKVSLLSDFYSDMFVLITPPDQVVNKEVVAQNFERWFQRWKALGVSRLLVFHSPLSILADYDAYYCQEQNIDPVSDPSFAKRSSLCRSWLQHKAQLKALYDAPAIKTVNYGNIREMDSMLRKIMWHLNPEYGALFKETADRLGIEISVAYHPFEHTVSKYYDLPTFSTTGEFKWFFSLFGRPEYLYEPQRSGFAHYREILAKGGQGQEGLVSTIELFPVPQTSLAEAKHLFIPTTPQQKDAAYTVYASSIPPIADGALVLQQTAGHGYRVVAFKDIAADVYRHMQKLPLKQVVWNQQTGALRLEGLSVAPSTSFLIIKGPERCAANNPLVFNTQHGLERVRFYNIFNHEMDKIAYFWSFDDDTRVNYLRPSPLDGALSNLFFADLRSHRKLKEDFYRNRDLALCGEQVLAIHLGDPYSSEILDFELSEVRAHEVKHLKYLTALSNTDSILVNSRSHVDSYGPQNGQYVHLAYAPRSLSVSTDIKMRPAAAMIKWFGAEEYGSFNPQHSCQTADCPIPYRYQRNLAVARGLQMLLADLSGFQVEVLLPESHIATAKLSRYKAANGMFLTDFLSSNNYNPWFHDGLGLLDLKGLAIKPSYMGLRGSVPSDAHLRYYLSTVARDLQGGRGASYRGYRSFLWEPGPGLAGEQKKRGICAILSAPDIDEVILYEAYWHRNLGSMSFLDSPDCK